MGEERNPEGVYGEEGYLSFEKFPHMALSKVRNSFQYYLLSSE